MTTDELMNYVYYVRSLERIRDAAQECINEFDEYTFSALRREVEVRHRGPEPEKEDASGK